MSTFPVRAEQSGPATPIGCPQCGAFELFQKASAIYEEGSSRVDGRTRWVGWGVGFNLKGAAVAPAIGLGVAGGRLKGIQRTDIAARLAPPAQPYRPRPRPGGRLAPSLTECVVWGLAGAMGGGLVGLYGAALLIAVGARVATLQGSLPSAAAATMAWIVVASIGLTLLLSAAGTVLGGAFAVWCCHRDLKRSRPDVEAAWSRWDDAMAGWQRLWYCSRCGNESRVP
jgi:hypothetical protein